MVQKIIGVTGAAGQIGTALIKRLAKEKNIRTIAICRNDLSSALLKSHAPEVEIRTGAITDKGSIDRLLGDCDIIINCALAMVSANPRKSKELNKAIIENISKLKKVNLIIHLSSVSVYGACIHQKNSNDNTFENPSPDSDYGRSKLFIEKYACKFFENENKNFYILRLGHVYGANMDRSKQIYELIKSPGFMLPYDGRIDSNAIHIDILVQKIIELFEQNENYGVYNAAEKYLSWRKIFDWHSVTVKLEPVQGMSNEKSNRQRKIYLKRSIIKDILSWFRTLPILSIIRYPSVFDYAFKILEYIPERLILKLSTKYKRLDVKKQINNYINTKTLIVEPTYFSGPMPGRYLKIFDNSKNRPIEDESLTKDLKNWYDRYANPLWLTDQK